MDVPSYLLGKKASGGGSYTETDPIFSVSPASGITSNDITNWNGKQNTLVSGTNIKTINDESILGSGNIEIQGGGATYTAGTNIEITNENVINNTIAYFKKSSGYCFGTTRTGESGLSATGLAVGNNNVSVGWASITIGSGSNATAETAIAIGANANAHGTRGIAIGRLANAEVENAITIGGGDNYSGYKKSIAIGYNANPTEDNICILGSNDFNINKIKIYTSSGEKEIATQEFVQNYLTTVSGYDSAKTQVLKNINGTLTWVDE